MLRELHISNLAVIVQASMEFTAGLNVFTGQTGAGKSLLIGAIEFLLGLRSGGEQATAMIRSGAEEARVMGLFEISDDRLRQDVKKILDRPLEDDSLLITRRLFATGRSSISINGEPATAPMLRTLGERLIDIHGQHDQQYLLKSANQRLVLDDFAGTESRREAFAETYRELQTLRVRREQLQSSAALRIQRLELLEYQVDEIDAAELTPGEYATVQQNFTRLSNAGKLQTIAGGLLDAMDGSEDSLNDRLHLLGRELDSLAKLDFAGAGDMRDAFVDAQAVMDDLSRSLERYADNIDLDDEALMAAEQRLDLLNRLIDKYADGPTENPVAAVLDYRDVIGAEVDALKAETADLTEMDDRISGLESRLVKQGAALSEARKKAGKKLGPLVEAQLAELGMEQASFAVRIDTLLPSDPAAGPSGLDMVEFMVCTNPGQSSQPLQQIASGGEISRIMLALKSILAAGDRVPVLIFDEIDANIGGRLGSVVGRTLRKLVGDGHHQVLCITHLAQIAAFAETHLHIAKTVSDDTTQTEVRVLEESDRAAELAEMLAGTDVSETTLTQARELLAAAAS